MPRSFSRPHSVSHRHERVGELIRHAIAEILARGEVRDEAFDRHPLTVPAVRNPSAARRACICAA